MYVIAQMRRGQSLALAFEDAVLLARLLDATKSDNPQSIFTRYEELRRPRVDHQYKNETDKFEIAKASWWKQNLREALIRVHFKFFETNFNNGFNGRMDFSYNVFQEKL
jgi:2-polyprenyl-6-methoxyphenol hydroxylase-like FAD-dependent oxidoreductase